MEAEVLKFEAPDGMAGRSLFLSNLPTSATTQMIKAIFLEFGAIHWVYLKEEENDGEVVRIHFGLVKFYSLQAAKEAMRQSGRIEVMGHKIKISYPRRANFGGRRELSLGQCFELLNYHVGFDGWSSWIHQTLQLEGPPQEGLPTNRVVEEKFIFRAEVYITIVGLSGVCVGVGYGHMNKYAEETKPDGTTEKFHTAQRLSKQEILQRVKKQAVRNAYLNAFSKIALVILSNRKVAPVFLEEKLPDVKFSAQDLDEALFREDVDNEYLFSGCPDEQ